MIPHDAFEFLAAGRTLQYDVESSDIGAIQLNGVDDLKLSVMRVPVYWEYDAVEDPYKELDGRYHVEVVDLIAESEDYDPRGLFCWIPALEAYGSIDADHGAIVMFPNTNWAGIVASPADYLNAQWEPDRPVARLIPSWRHFTFQVADSAIQLPPYGNACPLHGTILNSAPLEKPRMLEVYRIRELADWLRCYLADFPCAGVPDESGNLFYCPQCRDEEDRWLRCQQDAIAPLEATPNQAGYVLCPGCQIRFSINDRARYAEGVHLSCGQKVLVKGS